MPFYFVSPIIFSEYFLLIHCVMYVTASVQWKRLVVSSEPPPARAYHSMTRIGSRFLLFGGYDGKSTFGDMWWLVPEGFFHSFSYFVPL